jgi:hypothetical protein
MERVLCPGCGGEGTSPCNHCGGSGGEWQSGGGVVQCDSCKGKGVLPCERCEGSGTVLSSPAAGT